MQGWDQTGSNGANLSFPIEFGIPDTVVEGQSAKEQEDHSWLVGLVNAAPYIGAALIGCWVSLNVSVTRPVANPMYSSTTP